MSHLYCDAAMRIFTVQANPPGSDRMSPQEFAFMKGAVQRTLFEEGFGPLIRAWSNLTAAVDPRTLELHGLDSPTVRGDENAILAHAVGEMNAARGRKPDLVLAPVSDGLPPGPVCTIRGPVHDDIHMRMIHLGDGPWTLTSGPLTLAIGIQLEVTLPLYPFDRRP